jgi:hypothetical protein
MFSGDVDSVLVAGCPPVAYAPELCRMVPAAVPDDGRYREYCAFRVSRLLRPASVWLLFERTECVPHLASVRSESRCGCDVGDRLTDFPRPCNCCYRQASATEGTASDLESLRRGAAQMIPSLCQEAVNSELFVGKRFPPLRCACR